MRLLIQTLGPDLEVHSIKISIHYSGLLKEVHQEGKKEHQGIQIFSLNIVFFTRPHGQCGLVW